LAHVDGELKRLGGLCLDVASDPPPDPGASITCWRTLHRHERDLHLLRAHVVRVISAHRLHRALGFSTLLEFVESALGLSERTARALVAQSFLFEDEPLLARAYREGRIGRGQAWLVHRVALTDTQAEHIRRASGITHLQLEREVHFLERLRDLAPSVWAHFPGALPQPGLEGALLDELVARGADRSQVLEELDQRGLVSAAPRSSGAPGPGDPRPHELHLSEDPAANPIVLRRLQVLLDLLALAVYSAASSDATPPSNLDRQTLAPGRRPSWSTPGRVGWTTISFWAPESIHEAWEAALSALRQRWGPLPTWAAVVLFLEHALDVWGTQDPATRPTEARILERDGYACQAPGCSARRRLEVHHIVFRSRGGADKAWNKTTLCHAHHHHAIHAGIVRLTGRAPTALRWEMGRARDGAVRWTLRGSRILPPC
jgi:hypothetical protein